MLEEYKVTILRFLLNAKNIDTVIKIPVLSELPENVHSATVNELVKDGLIRNSIAGFKINQSGEDFLAKYDFAKSRKEVPLREEKREQPKDMRGYYTLVLRFLSAQTEVINLSAIAIDEIAPSFVKTIVNDLIKDDLINAGIGGYVWINQNGTDYLNKHDMGLHLRPESGAISINIGNTTISGQNTFINSDVRTFADDRATHPKKAKAEIPSSPAHGALWPVGKWLAKNIWLFVFYVLVGIAIWYFTIYNPILNPNK